MIACTSRSRAVQTAFFDHRYLLKADLDRLLARRREGFGSGRVGDLATAASGYASTTHAAAAALSLIFDDPLLRIAASLDVRAIAADGSTITADGEEIEAPQPLRPYLRAQRLIRLVDGAAEDDPLFLSDTKQHCGGARIQSRTTARGLQALVRALARETGLPLIVRYSTSKRTAERAWIYDLGLSVQRLRHVSLRNAA